MPDLVCSHSMRVQDNTKLFALSDKKRIKFTTIHLFRNSIVYIVNISYLLSLQLWNCETIHIDYHRCLNFLPVLDPFDGEYNDCAHREQLLLGTITTLDYSLFERFNQLNVVFADNDAATKRFEYVDKIEPITKNDRLPLHHHDILK